MSTENIIAQSGSWILHHFNGITWVTHECPKSGFMSINYLYCSDCHMEAPSEIEAMYHIATLGQRQWRVQVGNVTANKLNKDYESIYPSG